MNRNSTLFFNSFKEYSFLDSKYIEIKGGMYQLPCAIEPTKGEHNLDICENCREQRQIFIKELTETFDKFPNCCKPHSKLNELKVFDRKDYESLPTMIADKIMYSYHHVVNNLDNDDWYEDISDYFDYCYESFGSFPNGYGEPFRLGNYLKALKGLLNNIENKISSDKMSQIDIRTRMSKVISLLEPVQVNESGSERDFNLLLSKYEEWYKIFPFDLPYFSHLREKFRNVLPKEKYTGKTRYNKYLKVNKIEYHTKDSITAVLLRITINILNSINGLTLYEEGLISDTDKHKLDLITSNRKLELYELSSMPSKNKTEYVKILKRWFKEEKIFIAEITPLLKDKEPFNERVPELSIKQIALKLFYEGFIINRNNAKEVIKEYGHTSGDKLFQEYTYFSSLANRKGSPSPLTQKKFQNKIKLFESVINLLSDNHKQRASDELNILKVNYQTHFE